MIIISGFRSGLSSNGRQGRSPHALAVVIYREINVLVSTVLVEMPKRRQSSCFLPNDEGIPRDYVIAGTHDGPDL